MAHWYDRKHTATTLPSQVYLRLAKGIHGGYRLADSSTLSVIKQGPFKVLRRIGKLAYELELPKHIKIHPVISVAHLEPATEDPYHRPHPPPGPILVEGNEEYVVKNIIGHEERGNQLFYRIHWEGYQKEEATWEPAEYIQKKLPQLVKDYERTFYTSITHGRGRIRK
jgi:hypothetical protein